MATLESLNRNTLASSAVTNFYLVCVASILILVSVFPISTFRLNTFDFRQPLVPISIFGFFIYAISDIRFRYMVFNDLAKERSTGHLTRD